MLWNQKESFALYAYKLEAELEETVQAVKDKLFGIHRVYLDVKKKIGLKVLDIAIWIG